MRKAKKRNFSEVEVETLVGEMEARKVVLLAGHGIGIANNKKQSERQHVATDRVHCCSNMLPLTLLFAVGDPNPVTAKQNYFSGLHLTHTCLHFNLCEISPFCFPQSFCYCFRQDIILASESVLYADRIHEVICIDHLWLKRGVYRAEREADCAHL